ncbi:hypothetical protein CHS0354_021475, partial [Potamilus streckersoni]
LEVIDKYNKTSKTISVENGYDDNTIQKQEKRIHIVMKQSNSTEVEEGNPQSEMASSVGNTQENRTVLQLIKQMVMSRNFYIISIVLLSVGYGNVTITTLYK